MELKSRRRHVPILWPTKLYREDLERIGQLFLDVADEVRYETEEYRIKDSSSLYSLSADSLNFLYITGLKGLWPSIYIEIYPRSVHLVIPKDDPKSLGVLENVRTLLQQRRRPFWVSSLFLSSVAILVASNCLAEGGKRVIAGDLSALPLFAVGIVFGLLWYWFANRYPHNIVVLKPKKEDTSFWKRNSDTIVVTVISIIFTAIVTYVVTRLTTPP